jgi:hypothetical protein
MFCFAVLRRGLRPVQGQSALFSLSGQYPKKSALLFTNCQKKLGLSAWQLYANTRSINSTTPHPCYSLAK